VAFSAFVTWEAWRMEYYTSLGPGPGFFPFWLGVVMGGLSLVWFFQASHLKIGPKAASLLPQGEGMRRLLSVLVALLLSTFVMDYIGFQLSMFFLLVFLLRVHGQQGRWITLIVAVAGSAGIFHLFGSYLDVQLPRSAIAFLAALGL